MPRSFWSSIWVLSKWKPWKLLSMQEQHATTHMADPHSNNWRDVFCSHFPSFKQTSPCGSWWPKTRQHSSWCQLFQQIRRFWNFSTVDTDKHLQHNSLPNNKPKRNLLLYGSWTSDHWWTHTTIWCVLPWHYHHASIDRETTSKDCRNGERCHWERKPAFHHWYYCWKLAFHTS